MVHDLNPKNLHINNGLIILQSPKQKSYIQGLLGNYPTNGFFFSTLSVYYSYPWGTLTSCEFSEKPVFKKTHLPTDIMTVLK